jgi:hypothetical protein
VHGRNEAGVMVRPDVGHPERTISPSGVRRGIQHPIQALAREERAAQDDRLDSGGVCDVDERIATQQHKVREFRRVNRSDVAVPTEKAGRLDRGGRQCLRG